jgi:hypothetical protein
VSRAWRSGARALGLALALSLPGATPSGAVSQSYLLGPGATFTPAGAAAESLAGDFELTLVLAICPQGMPLEDCRFDYDVSQLAFTSPGLDLDAAPPQAIPGLLEFSFSDLGVDPPDPPEMGGFVVERSTLPPQAQHEQRFRDLVLRTSAAGVPDNQLVFDPAGPLEFPVVISFDLELVEVLRLVIFDSSGDHVSTLSTTTLGTLAFAATPVPEPGAGALLGGGLALLAASSRRAVRRPC